MASVSNFLGSGISFLDTSFKWHFITNILSVNKTSHATKYNAELLAQFNLDGIKATAKFFGSHTTNCAVGDSNCFEDIEQKNCELDKLILILMYGMGLKEHYKTIAKVQQIVTVGGDFAEGLYVLIYMKEVCAFLKPSTIAKFKKTYNRTMFCRKGCLQTTEL